MPRRKLSSEELRIRAGNSQAILNMTAYQEAFGDTEEAIIFDVWLKTAAADVEERERCWRMVKSLHQAKKALETCILKGKEAAQLAAHRAILEEQDKRSSA